MPVEQYEVFTCATVLKDLILFKRDKWDFPIKTSNVLRNRQEGGLNKRRAKNTNHKLCMVASQYMFAEIKLVQKAREDLCLSMSTPVPCHHLSSQHFPFHAYGSLSLYWESGNSRTARKALVEGSFHASLCAKCFPFVDTHFVI